MSTTNKAEEPAATQNQNEQDQKQIGRNAKLPGL